MKPIILFFCIFCVMLNSSAQYTYQEITPSNGQSPFLIGTISLDALSSKSYQKWYTPRYDSYEVASDVISSFKTKLATYHILVFMGTWCGDSKREIPRFIKILKEADFPLSQLKIVAVDKRRDRYKKSPTGEEWGLDIKRVPTFIFYKNGKEVNRIVESPVKTLENDIAAIINTKTYTPNYTKSFHFDD